VVVAGMEVEGRSEGEFYERKMRGLVVSLVSSVVGQFVIS
jgi:hypothetical protein